MPRDDSAPSADTGECSTCKRSASTGCTALDKARPGNLTALEHSILAWRRTWDGRCPGYRRRGGGKKSS